MAFVGLKCEVLILMDKTEEGISFSTSIQNQFIDNPEFLYWRGLLLVYSGNLEMGKKYVREALNKDPDNAKYQRMQRNLMKMEKLKKEAGECFSSGQFQNAIELFSECLQLDPLNKQYNQTVFFNRALAF